MAASSSIAEHDTETEYTPRHSWGAVRLSTSHAQLRARLTVVDAVGEPEPEYRGRHQRHPWSARPCDRHDAGKVCASCSDIDLATDAEVSQFVAEHRVSVTS